MAPSDQHSAIIAVIIFMSASESDALDRQRRQLLWTNSTLFQPVMLHVRLSFNDSLNGVLAVMTNGAQTGSLTMGLNLNIKKLNIGVTTPTPIKTVNVGWAFQANFQLPWNRTQIPFDLLEANSGYTGLSRRKREDCDYENDARLYHFYKYVEDVLNSYGHNGTACVLQTLCQLGAEPLHSDDEENLMHELTTYILNPSNDITEGASSEAAPYVQAYQHGQKLLDCSRKFHCNSISLIDMFSKPHFGS